MTNIDCVLCVHVARDEQHLAKHIMEKHDPALYCVALQVKLTKLIKDADYSDLSSLPGHFVIH